MNFAARLFFKTIRLVMTPPMLIWEKLSAPEPLVRTSDEQQKVLQACQSLVLYQFRACPFCIKVRKEMHRLALDIELRDARNDTASRTALQQGGGRIKVPCLKISDDSGENRWVYESTEIIRYLNERFA